MIQAIITACGGGQEHQEAFAAAWRRLELAQDDTGPPVALAHRPRALYSVSEPA